MGIYVHIYGAIEATRDQLPMIRFVLESARATLGHYVDSWSIPDVGGGYMVYVFFGCPVRESALNDMRTTVRAIAEQVCTRDGNDTDFPEGLFSVVHELPEQHPPVFWYFKTGIFREEPEIRA